jgi:hypothetical protein
MMVVILVLEMSEKNLLLRWLAGIWVSLRPRVSAAGHNRGTGINALLEKLLGPAFVVAVDVNDHSDNKAKVKVNNGVFVHAHTGQITPLGPIGIKGHVVQRNTCRGLPSDAHGQ